MNTFTSKERNLNVTNCKLSNILCNTKELENLLKNLNIYKSPGPDSLPPRILKECASVLSSPLCFFFNKSFSTGKLPHLWKLAKITPLFKKGSKTDRYNYRQISLTSIVCKNAEKIVKSRVMDFWRDINILNPNQFAYMEGRSTVSELLSCYDDWARSRNNRKPTDIAFLDFSKAFDSVPHERLLFKLERHGIDGSALQWFRNFLTGRMQRVVLCGTCSSWSPVLSGVPQGTILGPVLFILYVNDISSGISSTVKLYADDTKVYREISDIARDTSILQSDLFHLRNWSEVWQLTFNAKKCEIMRVTHNRDESVPHYSLVPRGERLSSVSSVKDLGITISHDLSWTLHVVEVVNKANKVLGLIKRTIGSVNKEIFSTVYKALVRPILEYASLCMVPLPSEEYCSLRESSEKSFSIGLRSAKGRDVIRRSLRNVTVVAVD